MQLLDKQPRLTVARLKINVRRCWRRHGIPYSMVERDIAEGGAWSAGIDQRNRYYYGTAARRYGEAKHGACGKYLSCRRKINSARRFKSSTPPSGKNVCSGSGPKRFVASVPFWQLNAMMISQPIMGIRNQAANAGADSEVSERAGTR